MKKRSIIFGTCLCLMLSLAACSKKTTEESNTESSNVKVTLGQYKGIEVTMASTEVTDAEVQAQLDNFNNNYGTPIKITDRTDVQKDDIANIDYVGKIDGEAFDNGAGTGYDLTIGSGSFIPGFEDGLIGKTVGETYDIPVTFPNPYTKNPDMSGKDAVFTVTINYIHKGEVEPLSDEVVAAGTNNTYTTIDAYKEYLKNSLKTSKESSANTQKEIDILNTAIDNATIEGIEQTEFDEQEEMMRSYYEDIASGYGVALETYVYVMFGGMTEEQFNTELKTAAEFNIKERYLLEEIVKVENISISDEEYDTLVADYMLDTDYTSVEEFEEACNGKEEVRKSFALEKAIQLILDSAVVINE